MAKEYVANIASAGVSSDDEAPEAISLSTSKDAFLQKHRAQKAASQTADKIHKEARREQDAKFKAQAEERKRRLEQVLADMAAMEAKQQEKLAKKQKKTAVPTVATKRIFVDEKTPEEVGEVTISDKKKVVLLKDRLVIKANIEAAAKLASQRSALLFQRNQHLRKDVAAPITRKPFKPMKKGLARDLKRVIA